MVEQKDAPTADDWVVPRVLRWAEQWAAPTVVPRASSKVEPREHSTVE